MIKENMSIEPSVKNSVNSTISDYKERFSILVAWQQIYDERISRLFILILGVFSFYLYFGVIAPTASKARLNKLEIARNDLKKISAQYKLLRDRYSFFTSQSNAAIPISIFSHTIIPAIQIYDNDKQELVNQEERKYLDDFSKDLKTLSELYNEKRRRKTINIETNTVNNEQFRRQLASFRKALGTLLIGKHDTLPPKDSSQEVREPTEEIERVNDKVSINKLNDFLVDGKVIADEISVDDPINSLQNLDKLEQVIQNMIKLDKNPANSSLMAKARESLPSELRNSFSSTNSGVYFGDTVTQSFALYQNVMQDYSSAPEPFEFTSSKDLSSYKTIKEYLDTPFDITTIEDLDRLKEYADGLINKNTSEAQSPILNVPIINTNIDRTVILIFLPVLILSLIYAINIYVYRYYNLISEISSIKGGMLDRKDIARFAPLQFFHHLDQLTTINSKTNKALSFSIRTNNYFSKLLMFMLLLMPLWVACIFFYGLHNQRYGIIQSWELWFVLLGIVIVILMSVEIYLVFCHLAKLAINKDIRNNLSKELSSNFSKSKTKATKEQVLPEANKKINKKPLKGDKDENTQ
jgi:hypothetical protein